MTAKSAALDAWYGSWMADPDFVDALDRDVRTRLLNHSEEKAPPIHLARMVENIETALQQELWFFVVIGCAMLGELLYGSVKGGRYEKEIAPPELKRGRRLAKLDSQWVEAHSALRDLRDASVHPALVSSTYERSERSLPLDVLIGRIAAEDQQLAADLHDQGMMGEDLARWAILRLAQLGEVERGE